MRWRKQLNFAAVLCENLRRNFREFLDMVQCCCKKNCLKWSFCCVFSCILDIGWSMHRSMRTSPRSLWRHAQSSVGSSVQNHVSFNGKLSLWVESAVESSCTEAPKPCWGSSWILSTPSCGVAQSSQVAPPETRITRHLMRGCGAAAGLQGQLWLSCTRRKVGNWDLLSSWGVSWEIA